MDFNKWIYQGIPYVTKSEEQILKKRLFKKDKETNNNLSPPKNVIETKSLLSVPESNLEPNDQNLDAKSHSHGESTEKKHKNEATDKSSEDSSSETLRLLKRKIRNIENDMIYLADDDILGIPTLLNKNPNRNFFSEGQNNNNAVSERKALLLSLNMNVKPKAKLFHDESIDTSRLNQNILPKSLFYEENLLLEKPPSPREHSSKKKKIEKLEKFSRSDPDENAGTKQPTPETKRRFSKPKKNKFTEKHNCENNGEVILVEFHPSEQIFFPVEEITITQLLNAHFIERGLAAEDFGYFDSDHKELNPNKILISNIQNRALFVKKKKSS